MSFGSAVDESWKTDKGTTMDKIKIAILREHLPYELDMLDEAAAYLQSKEFGESVNVRERGGRLVQKERSY